MEIPELTHLQLFVLGVLCSQSEVSGKDIRKELAQRGCKKSAPAFYQLMSRLEDGRLVEGRYNSVQKGNMIVRERTYRVTGEGRRAVSKSIEFAATLNAFVSGGLQGA